MQSAALIRSFRFISKHSACQNFSLPVHRLYEVLLESRLCWLYFDLEYWRVDSPDFHPQTVASAFFNSFAQRSLAVQLSRGHCIPEQQRSWQAQAGKKPPAQFFWFDFSLRVGRSNGCFWFCFFFGWPSADVRQTAVLRNCSSPRWQDAVPGTWDPSASPWQIIYRCLCRVPLRAS